MLVLNRRFRDQIRYLLEKNHLPWVTVRPSTVPEAGRGVFLQRDIPIPNNSSFSGLPHVVALYPGIYTPGMPVMMNDTPHGYLAHQVPPSGIPMSENAYILNLRSMGGYLDGAVVACEDDDHDKHASANNPSACGHYINHAPQANVQVLSFEWNQDVVIAGEESSLMTNNPQHYFPLPNTRRCDQSPWYYDAEQETVISFPNQSSTPKISLVCGGAALVLVEPLAVGDELFLDYQLNKNNLPAWAKDWYQ